jgi:spermidine/putrescine transport system permease protein
MRTIKIFKGTPMHNGNSFKFFSLSTIWLWLIIFSLIPYALVTLASFLSHDETHLIHLPFSLSHYAELSDPIYIKIFQKSFYLAGLSTLICLVVGYPFAYIISRAKSSFRRRLRVKDVSMSLTSSTSST